MTVGDDDGPHPVGPLKYIAHVGDDDVNAQHVALGKHQAAVNNQQLVVVFDHQHILADVAQPSQRDDF